MPSLKSIRIKESVCVLSLNSAIYPSSMIMSTAKDFEAVGKVSVSEVGNGLVKVEIITENGIDPQKVSDNFFDCLLCRIQNAQ